MYMQMQHGGIVLNYYKLEDNMSTCISTGEMLNNEHNFAQQL